MGTPYLIAKDTWVIPHEFPVPSLGLLGVNSLVITGKEPVLVDTGTAVVRESWLAQVWSVVDPGDVRWIFLSHDDCDHVGNLEPVLAACANARIVTGSMMMGRLSVEQGRELPAPRCLWVNSGDAFDAGDRTLVAVRPPVFDSPTTRGLFDPTTGVYWASDAFGQFVAEPMQFAAEVASSDGWDSLLAFNRMICPWHTLFDAQRYAALVDSVEQLGVESIAGAHGPVLTGSLVGEAFRRIRQLSGLQALPEPGQHELEAMLAAMQGGAAVPTAV
jgi:flavorubredoxin